MDINSLSLGIVLSLLCYSSALVTDNDNKDRDYKNLLSLTSTTEKMFEEINSNPDYHQTSNDFKTFEPKSYEGRRLWQLKRMVKKMERHRPRRNILGILKDSVNNNLSNLLLHALDEDPPSDYKFEGSLWSYPRDSDLAWREREHKQSSQENVDPMMKWVGIGK